MVWFHTDSDESHDVAGADTTTSELVGFPPGRCN